MLRMLTEWNDAPGVKDAALAATWARLEIADDSTGTSRWLSRVIRSTTNSVQRGVYGPMLPLAEWIVENWWFLFHEGCRIPEFSSGRELARDPVQRAWVQRHNFLAAREGGALPDMTIYRDGPGIAIHWAPDPQQDDRTRQVRFVEQGNALLEPAGVQQVFHEFVEAVLERLGGRADDSVIRLRENWSAVCESRQKEAQLCSWSASLGLDPYNPNQLTDELAQYLQAQVGDLSAELRHDLLDATTGDSLPGDLDWLKRALGEVSIDANSSNGTPWHRRTTAPEAGYRQAAQFRKEFALPPDPIRDLPALLYEHCGWPAPERQHVTIEGTHDISALAALDASQMPIVVGPRLGHWAERFRLARALYFLSDRAKAVHPRLVTRSYSWDQRASRAFAAELLAPAAAIRNEVANVVSAEQVDRLARQFDVDFLVIQHQIQNHRLAWVAED